MSPAIALHLTGRQYAMYDFDAEEIITSYSLGEDPFASLPPETLVSVRRGLVPVQLMRRVCALRGLTLVGTEAHEFEDSVDLAYLVLTPAR